MTPALVLLGGLAAAAVPPATGYAVARATAAPAALLAANDAAWSGIFVYLLVSVVAKSLRPAGILVSVVHHGDPGLGRGF
jgi:hypothetical protein